MNAFVVFDTKFGNTEAIARAIGGALGEGATVTSVASAQYSQLQGIQLLVVGSPTHGGRPTPAIAAWVARIPSKALDGITVAAFDTRIAPGRQPRWLAADGRHRLRRAPDRVEPAKPGRRFCGRTRGVPRRGE